MTRSPHPYARLIIGRDGRKQPPPHHRCRASPASVSPASAYSCSIGSHIYRASPPPELAHRVLLLPLRLLLVVDGQAGSSNRAWSPPPPPRGLTRLPSVRWYYTTTTAPLLHEYDRRLFLVSWFRGCLVSSLLCSAPWLPQRALDPRSFPLAFFFPATCYSQTLFIYLFIYLCFGGCCWVSNDAERLPSLAFLLPPLVLLRFSALAPRPALTVCRVPLVCLVFSSEK